MVGTKVSTIIFMCIIRMKPLLKVTAVYAIVGRVMFHKLCLVYFCADMVH